MEILVDTLRQRFADAVVEDLRTRLGITVLLEPLTYTRAIPAF